MGSMTADHGKTPLLKKLGIKPGFTLWLVGAPDACRDWLGPLPQGVEVVGETAVSEVWSGLKFVYRVEDR